MRSRALITGVDGQDGVVLGELLAAAGHEVFGLARRPSRRVGRAVEVVEADVADPAAVRAVVRDVSPDALYHLAAHHRSSDASDAEDEQESVRTNLGGAQSVLAAVRAERPGCRVFLAGSCHMFGSRAPSPQDESTPFAPNTIYGVTKVAACHLGRIYREEHGLFVCTGILYQHESPWRGARFVSQRIAKGAVDVLRGHARTLALGDVEAAVDWSSAGDVCDAMMRMIAADRPSDYVVASGLTHTVGELAALAFHHVGLDARDHVVVDPTWRRPAVAGSYVGDASRLRRELGWAPRTTFEDLAALLVDHHLSASSATSPA